MTDIEKEGFLQVDDDLVWVKDIYGKWHLISLSSIESIQPELDD